MKRAVIFLLVLLIAVSGLCYAVDRAVRAQLAETIRQIQSDKHTSLASWEYDSISRRLVLRDVQYAAPENGLTVTAQELQAVISLRAILHAAPQLDFLLSSQGYLTLLDDWQGTDVTLRQSLPEGEENDCTVARVEGSALAVAVEQFKRLRDASTDAAFLRDCAFRSLRLEKPAFSRRGGQQTPIRLEAGTLELEKANIRQDMIARILLTGFSYSAGEDSLRLKEATLTELRPVTVWETFRKAAPDTFWDSLLVDISCGALQLKGGELGLSGQNAIPGKFTYSFEGVEMTRGEKAGLLKHILVDQAKLTLPLYSYTPAEISISFDRHELYDVLLAETIALVKNGTLPLTNVFDTPNVQEDSIPQPLFSRNLLKGICLTSDELTISADQAETLWEMKGDTQTSASTVTNIVFPKPTLRYIAAQFETPGLEELRCNFTEHQSLSNGIGTVKGSLTMDGLCDLDYSGEFKMKSLLSQPNTFRHLDMRLTDKGLMASLALNIDENPTVARMGMETLAQMVTANLPNGETMLPAIKTFIATPGELRMNITGDDWIDMQMQQMNNPLWLLQLATRLHLEATPGTPLEESVKAHLKKAAQ